MRCCAGAPGGSLIAAAAAVVAAGSVRLPGSVRCGARPNVRREAGRRPRAAAGLAARTGGGGLLYGIWTPALPSRAGVPAAALAQSAASR